MEILYRITQATLGHVLSEATTYYLTLACLVVALLIEAPLVYLVLRYFWRRSLWVVWAKGLFTTMNMKTLGFIGAVLVAVVTLALTGCDMSIDPNRFNVAVCPTNHWKVVAVGTDGKVMVQAVTGTNLLENLRAHVAEPVGSLTNGQSVRVEMVIRHNPQRRGVDIISSKAYPSWQ